MQEPEKYLSSPNFEPEKVSEVFAIICALTVIYVAFFCKSAKPAYTLFEGGASANRIEEQLEAPKR